MDLALAGNNHIYVATKPIYNDEIVDAGCGTVYIQSPSSDNERGMSMGEHTENLDLIKYRWTEGEHTVGAMLMKVTPETITISLYDRNGTLKDQTIINARVPSETPATNIR